MLDKTIAAATDINLATVDNDLGIVPANDAVTIAQTYANEHNTCVMLRDPVSDKLLKTIKPAKPTKATAKPAKAAPAVSAEVAAQHARPVVAKKATAKKPKTTAGKVLAAEVKAELDALGGNGADDIPPGLRRTETADEAEQRRATMMKANTAPATKKIANPETKPSTERRKIDTTKRKAKPTKSGIARAERGGKAKGPSGMVVEIMKLASRANGASREELNALTKWKGAPWKWLFKNPKKNGYCDRWSYGFKVIEGKQGEARYCVTKKS